MSNEDRIIKINSNQYFLVKTLKKSNRKNVYVACKNDSNGDFVAIKLEWLSGNPLATLQLEFENYERILSKNGNKVLPGIVEIYDYEFNNLRSVIAMKLLGPNLDEIFTLCRRQFTLKTMIYLTLQVMDILDHIHRLHFVHRNIAPENFLLSLRSSANWLYIIDLSFVKAIFDENNDRIPCIKTPGIPKGYPRYMSINAMHGYEQFERDDFESAIYMLTYFLRQGHLPWMNLSGKSILDKFAKIRAIKESVTPEMLTIGFPAEYSSILRLSQNLKHSSSPNYQVINQWFLNLFKREGLVDDGIYDWTNILETKEKTRKTKVPSIRMISE